MKLMCQSDHVNGFRGDTKHVIFSTDTFEDDVLDRSKLKVEGRRPARLVGQRNIRHLVFGKSFLHYGLFLNHIEQEMVEKLGRRIGDPIVVRCASLIRREILIE